MLRNNIIKTFAGQPFKKDKKLKLIEEIAKDIEFQEGAVNDGNTQIRASNIKWFVPNSEEEDNKVGELFDYIGPFVNGANEHSEDDKDGWGFELTAFEPMQYTIYDGDNSPGAHYGWHTDNYLGPPEDTVRKISFTILLSKPRVDFEGGDLIIEQGSPQLGKSRRVPVDLRQGDMVVFPSYHWHKVTPVTKGIRKSLVGWVRGPQWK